MPRMCINAEHIGIYLGQGYITTATLKDILHEIDETITDEDLNGMIEEIDEDGSGTVDFDGKILTRRCKKFICP